MKKYYHACVKVYSYDKEENTYKLWYIESFSSKKLASIYIDGLRHGMDQTKLPFKIKWSDIYVKFRSYKPKY